MRIALVLTASILGSSCSMLGLPAGPADNCRNYFAEDLICDIDTTIQSEMNHWPAPGHVERRYTAENWQRYWNDRATFFLQDDIAKSCPGYRGPTGHDLVSYALKQRQEYALPRLVPSAQAKDLVGPVVDDVEISGASSCDILRGFKYQCPRYANCPDKRKKSD